MRFDILVLMLEGEQAVETTAELCDRGSMCSNHCVHATRSSLQQAMFSMHTNLQSCQEYLHSRGLAL